MNTTPTKNQNPNEEILPPCKFKLIYVYTIHDKAHANLVKVGDATLEAPFNAEAKSFPQNCDALISAANKRIGEQTKQAGIHYQILHAEIAVTNEKEAFRDYDVHRVLKNSGVEKAKLEKSREWFKADYLTVKKAITAVKKGDCVIEGVPSNKFFPIEFREEQEAAICKAVKYFEKNRAKGKNSDQIENAKKKKSKRNEFLWNAKMRFGKTVCALEVAKRLKAQRTIIVTHRPDVWKGWRNDFRKIFDVFNEEHKNTPHEQYSFGGRGMEAFSTLEKKGRRFIYFSSMQDLTGSDEISKKGIDKNKDVLAAKWDLIIVDEAHEGTTTDLGERTLDRLKKKSTCVLHLSGTPFILAEDYDETNSFTWDYVQEQLAKQNWEKNHPDEPNPYASLPRMNIRTYSLGSLSARYPDVAEKCFKFSEFFRIGEDGQHFAHESDIKLFLDLLSGISKETTKYPFSTDQYREFFRHTFWIVPGVKQGAALEKLLKEHSVFRAFEIVNVCGDGGDDEGKGKSALEKVEDAIEPYDSNQPNGRNNPKDRTITLSCGRLKLGVSVPQWTAVFYLAGNYNTAAADYMQTIFRCQTPGSIEGKAKEECYVFDFAPDRTLCVLHKVAEYHSKTTGGDTKQYLSNITNFMPVIAIDGSETHKIDTRGILDAVKRACIADVVKNGFASKKLFKPEKLSELSDEEMKKFDRFEKIVGRWSSDERDDEEVVVNANDLTHEKHEGEDDPTPPRPPRPPMPPDEKDRKERREKALSILKNATIRIPLLIFGAGAGSDDDDPETGFTAESFLEYFGKTDDPAVAASWKEFMGNVTVTDFKEIVIPYLDEDIFSGACRRIRERTESADKLPPKERIEKIVEIHSEFKNPDKETVLTPWRVVNMQLGDTLGGQNFFTEDYTKDLLKEAEEEGSVANTREIKLGDATAQTLGNANAKILEINSKTGLYPLYVAYSMMRAKLSSDPNSPRKHESIDAAEKRLWNESVANNIFVICKTEMAAAITRRTLLGFNKDAKANIRVVGDLIDKAEKLTSDKNAKANLEEFLKKIKTWETEMDFDAIIGNPPYQKELKDTTDDPIYHHFVELAKLLEPRYISMIMPSRWMTASGNEMSAFREKILSDTRFDILHDFLESNYVFQGTSISGGVCFFRWNREHNGKCVYTLHDGLDTTKTTRDLKTADSDIFIRHSICAEILKKVRKIRKPSEPTFDALVSGQTPFRGLFTNFFKKESKSLSKKYFADAIEIWGREDNETVVRYAPESIFYKKDKDGANVLDDKTAKRISDWKFFIPYVNGSKVIGTKNQTNVIGKPIPATKNSACTQSLLVVGPFDSREKAENAISYLKTRTFRLLVGLRKITPYGSRDVYSFVPMQDFSEEWSDEKLYKKYDFTRSEKDFIEKMIAPMP